MTNNWLNIQQSCIKSIYNEETKVSWIMLNSELLKNFKDWDYNSFILNLRIYFSMNYFWKKISWKDVLKILIYFKNTLEKRKIDNYRDILKRKVLYFLNWNLSDKEIDVEKNNILEFLWEKIKLFKLNENIFFPWTEVSDLLVIDYSVNDFE